MAVETERHARVNRSVATYWRLCLHPTMMTMMPTTPMPNPTPVTKSLPAVRNACDNPEITAPAAHRMAPIAVNCLSLSILVQITTGAELCGGPQTYSVHGLLHLVPVAVRSPFQFSGRL